MISFRLRTRLNPISCRLRFEGKFYANKLSSCELCSKSTERIGLVMLFPFLFEDMFVTKQSRMLDSIWIKSGVHMRFIVCLETLSVQLLNLNTINL